MNQVASKKKFSTKTIVLDKIENRIMTNRTFLPQDVAQGLSHKSQSLSGCISQRNIDIQLSQKDFLNIPGADKKSEEKLFKRKKLTRGLTHFIKKSHQ